MRRCYQKIAVLGGFVLAGSISFNSGSLKSLTVYAAEENVETVIPQEENKNVTEQTISTYQILDEQEYEILLRIVEAEAGCEDDIGKLIVANVILNRVNSDLFPDTISEVVYQKVGGNAQFSPTANGTIDSVTVSESTINAVERALSGEDESNGAFFFRAVYCKSGWFDRNLTKVIEHGNHIFYTF